MFAKWMEPVSKITPPFGSLCTSLSHKCFSDVFQTWTTCFEKGERSSFSNIVHPCCVVLSVKFDFAGSMSHTWTLTLCIFVPPLVLSHGVPLSLLITDQQTDGQKNHKALLSVCTHFN